MTFVPPFPAGAPAVLHSHVVGLHHVALAVSDLDQAITLWQGTFGMNVILRKIIEDQAVEAAALTIPPAERDTFHSWSKLTELELITPLGAGSSVERFIERSGQGLHHLAWGVREIDVCIDLLVREGVQMIDQKARTGLHGTRVAFIHPASMQGVLTELVEVPVADA